VWRGDSHYGRVEAMEWAERDGADYIFGLAGNSALDALVAGSGFDPKQTVRVNPARHVALFASRAQSAIF
jgi:hypothetical protein